VTHQGNLLIAMGGSGMMVIRDIMATTANRPLEAATRFAGRSICLFAGEGPAAHRSRYDHEEDEWPPIDIGGPDGCFGTVTAARAKVRLSVTRDGMFVEVEPSRGFIRRPGRQSAAAHGDKGGPPS
jgi:hypothetical protein